MDENLDGRRGIEEYLLGILEDPAMKRQIEEKLLADETFDREMKVSEDELIEKYLDDELSSADRDHFENHFLAAPQRQQHLRLNRSLRKWAVGQGRKEPELIPETPTALGWRRFFSMPALSYALVFVVVLGLGYGAWLIAFNRSNDVETSVAELRLGYKGDRPFNSRIAGFDYAPPVNERGDPNKGPKNDPGDRAETLKTHAVMSLKKAVEDNRTAESLYGLGKAFLAERDFTQAARHMEEAATLAPAKADLQSDLGALYLEMSKKAPEKEKAELLDKSLRSLQRAIELNPTLPEPRYNRALCLEARGLREEAKQAWREYLELDPNSQWAADARRNLGRLEQN
jgi:tetratricopeptide (TPR) repeat protein